MYARAIAVCSKGDIPDVEMARFFLEAARKDGVDRNLFMFSAAIWTAERAGNYTEAKVLLEELKAAGLPPNTIAFTGVISAAARNGYVQEAFQLHLEMLGNGCKVTYATYNVGGVVLVRKVHESSSPPSPLCPPQGPCSCSA